MPKYSLHEFISLLESDGELSRISVSVNPVLEIAAITNRVCKRPGGGAALLFEHPAGSHFRVATNLFGAPTRVCRALGVTDLAELTARLGTLLDRIPELDVTSLDHQIASLPEFSRFSPQAATEADPALIRMNPPDLTGFPFLQSWPDDGAADGDSGAFGLGRYITLPQIFTTDPDGGTPNCGVYRVQPRGKREAAIQWKTGSGAARHAELFRRAGKTMPVAVVLGGNPATLFSAMFPLPGDLDEMAFAGFLRSAPVVMAPCRHVPLMVPVGAEVVIEGYVEPGEFVTEGPFGNHTGFYSPAAPAPLMRVTAICHRRDAIIPATVVGPPPMEDCWMAQAWERLLLAFLQRLLPSITDIRFPFESVFHQSAIISLDKPQPGMVRNIAAQLWALPWFASARLLLFVTAGEEPGELSHAVWKCINVTNFSDDIYHDRATGRVAIDATGSSTPLPEVNIPVETAALVAPPLEGVPIAVSGIIKKVSIFLEMIKFTHTIFALPFAFTGALLAAGGFPSLRQSVWIVLAMVGARTAAMAMNRLIDAEIDARNPRTAVRAIPAGLIGKGVTFIFIVASTALMLFSAYMLNPLCLKLAPIALFFLLLYSYCKRFTSLAHVVLGICLAAAPIGAWVAIRGTIDAPALVLGGVVLFWVAGFDILYALQDLDFDRTAGLHSIPVLLGVNRSLQAARVFHLIMIGLLFTLFTLMHLGTLFLVGILVSVAMLLYEHWLLRDGDLAKLDAAFFNMNGYISIAIVLFTAADILVR